MRYLSLAIVAVMATAHGCKGHESSLGSEKSSETEEFPGHKGKYQVIVNLGGPLTGGRISAVLQEVVSNSQNPHIIERFECKKSEVAPGMAADVTWESCAQGKYQFHLDNPVERLGSDYSGMLNRADLPSVPGYIFKCTVASESGVSHPQGAGKQVQCNESGREGGARPHPGAGVNNG